MNLKMHMKKVGFLIGIELFGGLFGLKLTSELHFVNTNVIKKAFFLLHNGSHFKFKMATIMVKMAAIMAKNEIFKKASLFSFIIIK